MADAAVESGETKVKTTPAVKTMTLTELKVADLKTELENRGLDKSGVKAALVERLRKAIEDEGEDPEEFLFESSTDKKTPKKEVKEVNDVKHESEEEEEEMDDEKQENRDAEVLQLSLDDKEDNIDTKEGTEDEQADLNESQESALKCEVSENSYASSTKEDDKSDTAVVETADDDATPSPEKNAQAPSAPVSKGKVASKSSVKVISRPNKPTQPAKNIWITNLAPTTRAADLKAFFANHGKVILVKIVTNAKQKSGDKKFYGYITMATSKDASKAVQDLNNTELNGQVVQLDQTTDQPNSLLKKTAKVVVKKVKAVGVTARASSSKTKEKPPDSKDSKASTDEVQDKEAKEDKSSFSRRDRERDHRSRDGRDYRDYRRVPFRRPFGFRGRGRGRGGFGFRERPPVESFRRPFGRRPFFGRMSYRPPMKPNFMFKMREDRQRERLRERSIRESERRRAEEVFRQKMIERKQREEAYRLEREKVQLRIEREMLEREKAEYLKNEREKQRMERERIEREREKLRRQAQMRDVPSKRPFPPGPTEREPIWEKEKRARHYESRYPSFSEKPPGSDGRQDFREPPPGYRHKFEHRPDHYERDAHSASTSRSSEFSKYSKDKGDSTMRDHDERRVYKRPYFKEDSGRGYPPREAERYAPPPDDRGYKRKIHENLRSPRPRGGGGGRRMPYY